MATMPVVWCTDPNSMNNKPAAFALHGIQLQGNVTEKQVLALRELVNAAAEGRLILPSDGTFMIMGSGISIESSIVSKEQNSATTSATADAESERRQSSNAENVDDHSEQTALSTCNRPTKNTYILMPVKRSPELNINMPLHTNDLSFCLEPKYSTFTPPQSTPDEEVLYDFLCCAKCMNDSSGKRCSSTEHSSSPRKSSIFHLRKVQSQVLLHRFLKSCERPSLSMTVGKENRHRHSYHQTNSIQDSAHHNGQNNFKVNEPQQLNHSTYSSANKYTRRYQRKHCNISVATIARNRHHNHRQKLPMHSVKILHNRSYACTIGGGGNSVTDFGDLPKSTTLAISVDCSKAAQAMNTPLVNEQPSLPTATLQTPLYATVKKQNAKSSMTMEINATVLADSGNIATACTDSQRPVSHQPSSRQRKIGTVHGSLQDNVLLEMHNFPHSSCKQPYNTCDIVMESLPVVRDLISFDDDDDANAKGHRNKQPNTCDTNSQILDILSQPNVDVTPAVDGGHVNKSPPPARSNASSRKTSFDSTCTISSMDSGFIEMQNKLDSSMHPPLASIFNGLSPLENPLNAMREATRGPVQEQGGEKIARLNYKECLTQSRNRRKSYEEFKAMFANSDAAQSTSTDPSSLPAAASDLSKVQMRRKTYQDLRNLFEKDAHCCEALQTVSNGQTEMALESISEQECTKLTTSTCTTTSSSTSTAIEPSVQLESIAVSETLLDLIRDIDDCDSSKPAMTINELANNTAESCTNEMDTAAHDGDECKLKATTTCLALGIANNDTINNGVGFETGIGTKSAASKAASTARPVESGHTTDILRKNSDFLSKILDRQLMANEKEKAYMRRKSYEEFKRLVRECEFAGNDKLVSEPASSAAPLKRQNSKHRKSYASFLLMRRNSKAKEVCDQKNYTKTSSSSQSENLRNTRILQPSTQLPETTTHSSSYKHNFKIYDKLIYGTIYDIIQRKNDIYNLTYQRYDKYMTYGTIYEILHRKSSQSSLCSTTSSASCGEKSFQRKSLTSILEKESSTSKAIPREKNQCDDLQKLMKCGMIYDIIQKQQQPSNLVKDTERKCNDVPDGQDSSSVAVSDSNANIIGKQNTAGVSNGHAIHKYGTIYDILQGEKSDGNNESAITSAMTSATTTVSAAVIGVKQQIKGHVKNRFVVSKIDESQTDNETNSGQQQSIDEDCKPECTESTIGVAQERNNTTKVTKPNKMRRLSHILKGTIETKSHSNDSYKGADTQDQYIKDEGGLIKCNLIPLDSDEVYSRIIAKNREKAISASIQKSNSLDAISTSAKISPPPTPSPPRPRRSLKQHKCVKEGHKSKQLPLVKKLSLDNSTPQDSNKEEQLVSTSNQDCKLRRWSNQIPLKCTCDHTTISSVETNGSSKDSTNSWDLALKPKSKCSCSNDQLVKITNAHKPHSHHNIHGGVIEELNPKSPSPSVANSTVSSRSTCSIHTELPCQCLAIRNNPKSSPTVALSNASKSSTSALASKKGKSRRLSEFTRGEFLNEKP